MGVGGGGGGGGSAEVLRWREMDALCHADQVSRLTACVLGECYGELCAVSGTVANAL